MYAHTISAALALAVLAFSAAAADRSYKGIVTYSRAESVCISSTDRMLGELVPHAEKLAGRALPMAQTVTYDDELRSTMPIEHEILAGGGTLKRGVPNVPAWTDSKSWQIRVTSAICELAPAVQRQMLAHELGHIVDFASGTKVFDSEKVAWLDRVQERAAEANSIKILAAAGYGTDIVVSAREFEAGIRLGSIKVPAAGCINKHYAGALADAASVKHFVVMQSLAGSRKTGVTTTDGVYVHALECRQTDYYNLAAAVAGGEDLPADERVLAAGKLIKTAGIPLAPVVADMRATITETGINSLYYKSGQATLLRAVQLLEPLL